MSPANDLFKNLFIFEMANNHMGDMDHGRQIIRALEEVCRGFDFRFGFKLQYRDLDTFIHPDYRHRDDIKYVKRFRETALTQAEFKQLKDEIVGAGFVPVCTPFDEISVDRLEEHGFEIIKIGSCSFTDWPLLERIVKTEKPIIASTAGASIDDLDRVVSFFEHRNKQFALMHCIGQYPTPDENLQLNQIDILKGRYPHVPIGYSTHEQPDRIHSIRMAMAKGAVIFEKHVGIPTEAYPLNAYSATPQQIGVWLQAAQQALVFCGKENDRYDISESEEKTLMSLRRGVFAKRDIKKDEPVTLENVFGAIPRQEHQLTMNEMSKYIDYYAQADIPANQPVLHHGIHKIDNVKRVEEIVEQVKKVLKESRVLVPRSLDLEISHHYGIDRFEEYGATIVNLLNREYCMKLIVLIPGQKHPEQYHKKKVETFRILYGEVSLELDGQVQLCRPGDIVTVEKGCRHIISTETGTVIEEISTTYFSDDSFYVDESIMKNPGRKTEVTVWSDS